LISDALQWLDTEQPDEAILFHLGICCNQGMLRCMVRLMPIGAAGRPVFVFDVAKPVYLDDGSCSNPFTAVEISGISKMLQSAGVDIADSWNGKGCVTASFSHRKYCGPSLRAALGRYDRGCLTHPKEHVFCHCAWLKDGHAALRLPEGWTP
jgi:hypothetical protein